MILSDAEIKARVRADRMIKPFIDHQVRCDGERKVISYGLSSYGYDAMVAGEFKIFKNSIAKEVDPKSLSDGCFDSVEAGDYVVIPPNSFALCRTVEYFRIPRNVLATCLGKSTYARCGVIVNVTPLEPEWEGHVTIELSNTSPLPAKIYPYEGICQFIFHESNYLPTTSYADRGGKYQGQRGITLPRV